MGQTTAETSGHALFRPIAPKLATLWTRLTAATGIEGAKVRKLISALAVGILCGACANGADDCRNTGTCPLPPDAGPTVIYVSPDAGPCDGVCAPLPPAGTDWSPQPFISWYGMTTALPASDKRCPPKAPVPSWLWHSAPVQALDCPSCSCAPSTGVCMLPETVTINPSPECPSDTTDAGAPFNPPSAWDGGCTANDAIAAIKCDGGTCSVIVGPTIPIDECAPKQVVIPKNVPWGFAAYTCTGRTEGSCADPGEVCTPSPPAGFSICVNRAGDDTNIACPVGYPARNVVYLAADDNRSCAPCGCEPPQGSSCSSLVSLYADDACSVQVGAVTATSSTLVCVNVPAGSPLGSKGANPPVYSPGSCQPNGGGQIGAVQPTDSYTFAVTSNVQNNATHSTDSRSCVCRLWHLGSVCEGSGELPGCRGRLRSRWAW